MPGPGDFTVEILQYAPYATSGLTAPIDISAYAKLDGLGSINRAVERDLLSFKTGDATLRFLNPAGYFDNLFAFFEPDDRWQLRLYRRGVTQFWGIIIGLGSVKFNRTDKDVEITAYGLTRFLQDGSAEGVQRTFADLIYPTSGFSPPISIVPLNDTTGLLPGDSLHFNDEEDAEDVVIKRVISSTQIETEASFINPYTGTTAPSDSPDTIVTVLTPYYRARNVEFLVRALFEASGVPLYEYRMSDSAFKYPAPAPINPQGLVVNQFQGASAHEANDRCYITLENTATYYQVNPEDAWTQEDALDRPWIDWSRSFPQGHAQPVILLRAPDSILIGMLGDDWNSAWDHAGGTGATPVTCYYIDDIPATERIAKRTSLDGITWAAVSGVADLPDAGAQAMGTINSHGCEYDPVRNALYCWWQYDSGNLYSQYYDITGGTFTDLTPLDGTFFQGFVYIPDLDYALALRSNATLGPNFQISAFRGTTMLWTRPFPRCLVRSEGASEAPYYPTRSLRYVNGHICGVISSDQSIQFLRTSDEFQSYRMNKIADGTKNTRVLGGRVKDQYRIFTYKNGDPGEGRNWMVADQTFAGVIDYADFEGKSYAEALRDMATVVNAVFYIDDEGAGHFVARDLYDSGNVIEIRDRIKTETDDLLWDNIVQYVEVSAQDGGSATAGDAAFAANGLSISSPYIPNAAFAQAVADSVIDFYSKRRMYKECTVQDTDGHIYRPLDRVTVDGMRWLVYESNHDLGGDEVDLKLLEDV